MRLLCYFPTERPYLSGIEINDDEIVQTLIDEIHKSLLLHKRVVDLDDIVLYKTDLPLEPVEDLRDRVLKWLQSEKEPLNFAKQLINIFPNKPASACLHIIIANPEVKEALDHVGDLDFLHRRKVKNDLDQQLKKLLDGPAPSEVVKTAQGVAKFLTSDNQSVCLDQIPAAMFSSELAHLQQDLDKLDRVDVGKWDANHASNLLSASVQFYDSEQKREDMIKSPINELLQADGEWVKKLDWAGGIIPDAYWFHPKTDFPIVLLELKNSVGISGDPFLQAVVDYSKIVSANQFKSYRGSCNFPTMLLGISGARLDIGVAVCVGSVYASRLLTLDISSGFHLAQNIIRIARIFKCLSTCRSKLQEYYDKIVIAPATKLSISDSKLSVSDTTDISALFPNPTLISGNSLPPLKYRCKLSHGGQLELNTVPRAQSRTTALYVAGLTIDGVACPVIVKFTSRYNAKAHELLFEKGYAPKLYSCQLVVGGVYMVVMEYLEGSASVWRMQNENPKRFPAPEVLVDVEEALGVLHNEGLVYGDLRRANVLCLDGRGKLVDFDWAGKDGEDRYPASLNSYRHWHEDVSAHAVMRKAHDLHLLAMLKAELVQQ